MPRFQDIQGQTSAHQALRRAAERGRLPHAVLFTGRAGVGKTSTAFALAQFLNCDNPAGGDACGACGPCHKLAKLQHPDLHWLFPMPASDKGRKLSADKRAGLIQEVTLQRTQPGIHAMTHAGAASIAIGRDEDTRARSISELRRQAGMAAVEARTKVYIVSEAERMTAEAANSLLKVLEEPPPDNLLVLTTERAGDLLDTIVSRCQRVRFQDLDEDTLTSLLLERGGSWTRKGEHRPPAPEAARLAAGLARGSLTRAQSMVEDGDVVAMRDHAVRFLGLRPGDPRLYDAVDAVARRKDRAEIGRILDFGLLWQADLLRVMTGSLPPVNRDREDALRREAAALTPSDLEHRMRVLHETRAAMLGNVYLPLVLHRLLTGMAGTPTAV